MYGAGEWPKANDTYANKSKKHQARYTLPCCAKYGNAGLEMASEHLAADFIVKGVCLPAHLEA